VNFNDWLNSVPTEITGDTLWKMEAYRLALFASDLGWHDVTRLMGDKRTIDLSSQLYRALGSIGACRPVRKYSNAMTTFHASRFTQTSR